MKARAVWTSGYKSVLDNGRGHKVVVDLPPSQGGGDEGPTALELSVMALAGCVNTIFAIVAKKLGLSYAGLETTVEAEKGALTIESVKVTVKVKEPSSKDLAEKVFKRTMRICPVGMVFEKSVKVEAELETA